jgi:hypothetical protein
LDRQLRLCSQSDRVDGCDTDETSIWRNAGPDLADDPIE